MMVRAPVRFFPVGSFVRPEENRGNRPLSDFAIGQGPVSATHCKEYLQFNNFHMFLILL
jgi:hypothetical protein